LGYEYNQHLQRFRGLLSRSLQQLIAQNIVSGDLVLDRSADREQTMKQLLALPGTGPWTVAYIAMRALGDPDAFPATDLGLRSALSRYGRATDPRSITAYAES